MHLFSGFAIFFRNNLEYLPAYCELFDPVRLAKRNNRTRNRTLIDRSQFPSIDLFFVRFHCICGHVTMSPPLPLRSTDAQGKSPRTRGVSSMVYFAYKTYFCLPPLILHFIMPLFKSPTFDFNYSMPRMPRTRRFRRPRQHFKSATAGVASKSMRNELARLVSTVADPKSKKVSCITLYAAH